MAAVNMLDTSSDDSVFSDINTDDDDECEEFMQELKSNNPGIEPYMFEPLPKSVKITTSDKNEASVNWRQGNIDWCKCSNCQVMATVKECRCCTEVGQVAHTMMDLPTDHPAIHCITEHPGFRSVCLDQYVLKTAWNQYKQQYGGNAHNGEQHKLMRHIAYRQLARWCWGWLGKDVRMVLPSCAVCAIRAHFPPPGLEEDAVFVGFQD